MTRRLDSAALRAESAGHLTSRLSRLDTPAALAIVDEATGHVNALTQLHDHLRAHPDALTSTSSAAPLAHQRLTRLLLAAGFDSVCQPRCIRCGQAKNLTNRVPGGRACGPCFRQLNQVECVRCGRLNRLGTTSADGPICDNCYFREHSERCSACGAHRPVNTRRPDGSPLCGPCNRPRRPCGSCGRVAPIKIRARDGQPDLCHRCHLGQTATCTICHRSRICRGVKAGRPICDTCRPRKPRTCGLCGQTAPIMVSWPIGPACKNCYRKIRENPRVCPACHRDRPLIGLGDHGRIVCGPCGGYDATYECTECGRSDDSVLAGRCLRCGLTARAREILTSDDGVFTSQMQQLFDMLRAVDNPRSMLIWLSDHRDGAGPSILRALAHATEPITHATLDDLPQGKTLRHIRDLLVTAEILPERNENLERLTLWLENFLADLPDHHAQLLRPHAHWYVLRRARRRASRSRFTPASARYCQRSITATARFLAWLDANEIPFTELPQDHLDRWLTRPDSDRYLIRRFITWAAHRHLIPAGLRIPEPPRPETPATIDEQQRLDQLRRCIHDAEIPLDSRVAGILVLLYGQQASTIVNLTKDHITERGQDVHLNLDRCPILVPPAVATLLLKLRDDPPFTTSIGRSTAPSRWLLPGLRPGRPIHPTTLVMKLNAQGIATRASRQAAVMTYAAELPSPVLADLLGFHINTAIRWAALAKRDWTHYIEARHTTASATHTSAGLPTP